MSLEQQDIYRLEWVADVRSPAPKLERTTVASLRELDEWLDRLSAMAEQQDPFVVELVNATYGALGMGLGHPTSALAFKFGDDPPYYESAGPRARLKLPGNACFYYQGQWSEFPPETLVPNETARAAMREFFATGKRPENIVWAEV